MNRGTFARLVACSLAMGAAGAVAQSYPEKPVRIVVPAPAGGALHRPRSGTMPSKDTPALKCGLTVPPFPAGEVHDCRDAPTNQRAATKEKLGENGTQATLSRKKARERD